MDTIIEKITDKLMPIATRLGQNRYLAVLRDAFMLAFPLTMFGSIIVVINNLPFFSAETQETLNELLGNGQNATMAIISVFVSFGIGYYLSRSYDEDPTFGGAISLASFLILTPFNMVSESGEEIGEVLELSRLGASGMFVAMLSAFLAAEIFVRISKRGWQIKMPEQVPAAVARSFSALIPSVVTLSVFTLINAGVNAIFNTNIHDVIFTLVQQPLLALGSSLPAMLISLFFIQLLWFFGLHGQQIVNSVMDPIWNTLMYENLEAYEAGDSLPNVITKMFMEMYTVGIGGSGMTLPVVLLMAFVMKSRQLKDIGRLAVAPALFNVNEPVIFGMPIVLNATVLIPWTITPLIVTIFNYFMMNTGLFPIPTGVAVPWTVPVFINGLLATNSIMGGVLQLIDMGIIALIWYPFLKGIDKTNLAEEQSTENLATE